MLGHQHRRVPGRCRPRRRLLGWLAAATAVAAAGPVLTSAPPAAAATATLCAQYAHVLTGSRGGAKVETRNDWWLRPGCLTASTTRAAFTVSAGYAADRSGRVVAFPDIMRGCQYGSCTPASGFPRQVSAAGGAVAKWYTAGNGAAGRHNTAFDIWFGRSADYSGHAGGAEIMIWLSSRNLGHPVGAPVRWIDGRRWWLSSWRTCAVGTSTCWNYVRFWAVHPTASVSWLALYPFMRAAERIGKLRSWWWLWNVEAGYECWSGGKGLQTTWFWARA